MPKLSELLAPNIRTSLDNLGTEKGEQSREIARIREIETLARTQDDELPIDGTRARNALADGLRKDSKLKLRYQGWLTGGENASDPAFSFEYYTRGNTHGKWQTLVEPMPDNTGKRR